MSFPLDWEENPPEIPKKGARVPNNIASFASWLRPKILEGELLDDKYLDWLYDYEVQHPAPGGASTFLKLTEEKTKREITAVQQNKNLPEAAAVVHQEGQRLDRVVEALSEGVRELRQGFTAALKEVAGSYQSAMAELRQGVSELRQGWTELNSDHRAYLGLHFPHQEKMYQLHNESMVAYRNGLVMESKAQAALAQSQSGVDVVSKQADLMMMGLVQDMARKKMGLEPKQQEAPKKPAQPKEAPTPAQAAAPAPAPVAAPPNIEAFFTKLMQKQQAEEAAQSVAPVSSEIEE